MSLRSPRRHLLPILAARPPSKRSSCPPSPRASADGVMSHLLPRRHLRPTPPAGADPKGLNFAVCTLPPAQFLLRCPAPVDPIDHDRQRSSDCDAPVHLRRDWQSSDVRGQRQQRRAIERLYAEFGEPVHRDNGRHRRHAQLRRQGRSERVMSHPLPRVSAPLTIRRSEPDATGSRTLRSSWRRACALATDRAGGRAAPCGPHDLSPCACECLRRSASGASPGPRRIDREASSPGPGIAPRVDRKGHVSPFTLTTRNRLAGT